MSQSTDPTFSTSRVDPGASQTPVGAIPIPAVTLRRVGPAHSFYDKTQVQQYIDLLTGASDMVTLFNVEVVEPTQSGLRKTPSENERLHPLGGADLMMDIDNENEHQRPPAAAGLETESYAIIPRHVNDNLGAPTEDVSREASIYPLGGPYPDLTFDHSMLPAVSNTGDMIPTPPDGYNPRLTQFQEFASSYRPLPSPNLLDVQCQACREDLRKPIFISCGHAYCQECLNRLFRIGTSNRASWPPKCCGGNLGIEIEGIQTHLDEDILIRYVTVSEEYGDRNPIYCANKRCSHYFEQTRISNKQGKFIQCSECDTQTCTECKQNSTEHIGLNQTTCKEIQDLMTAEDQKLANSKRWKQCPGCRNLVERIDGCSHMSCGCGVDFCYDCGIKREGWTTACSCRSRTNRARRQLNPDGETMPRRMRRVLESPIIPIPRRFRPGGEPSPAPQALVAVPNLAAPTDPATPALQLNVPPKPGFRSFPASAPAEASSTTRNTTGPISPVSPATPTLFGGPHLNDPPKSRLGLGVPYSNSPSEPVSMRTPGGIRTDGPPTTMYTRSHKPTSLDNRSSAARPIYRSETQAEISSNATSALSTATGPTTGRSTPNFVSATPKKPSERPLRPRLTPQYDNSRPLFSVSQGSSTKSASVPIQSMLPRRQSILPTSADFRTKAGDNTSTHSMSVSDKRSHSPDMTSQRRNARQSWVTGPNLPPFLLNSNRLATGETSQRPNVLSQAQASPGSTPFYAAASSPRPSQ